MRLEYVGTERYEPARMADLADVIRKAFGSVDLATDRVAPIDL